ncbi:MAG: hypothetical protein DMG97_00665 [Acidobacteria bacterium]|nr:MAG: hypothetical protein DMG97_00665 [Acidobacteriota bacterium]
MQLTVHAGKNPKSIFVAWNGSRGIKGRRRLLLSNAGNQCAREEIPCRSEEGRHGRIFNLQGPGIIAARARHSQRGSVRAVAHLPWQIGVEKMILTQYDSATEIAWQRTGVVDGQRLPWQPVPVSEFIWSDGVATEHHHSSRAAFDHGDIENWIRLRQKRGRMKREGQRILRACR